MRVHVQGHPAGDLLVDEAPSACGDIEGGVSMEFEREPGGFVLSFRDLENVVKVLANLRRAGAK
jgi:hypothetical protein